MKNVIIFSSLMIPWFICLPVYSQSVTGHWTIIEGVMAGKPVPADILAAMSLNLNRAKFEAKSGDTNSSGTFAIDRRISPSQLVFKIDKGADPGREIKAICQYVDGNMQIAFSQSDEFPTEFESNGSNRNLLLTYKSTAPALLEKKPKGISAAGSSGPGG